ncbi:MAG: sulfide/dihydroorotate dehydrogenase-like FAD/NAD-binding protein [Candidatus Helarchaeota archaeon]|nr:sulfide/dihydroorotate dehydrogenase-like FAD/NAD-binding protein [Candidatus Helarchaeota archaeon]
MPRKKLTLKIDDKLVEFKEGQTILEIAKNNDIYIPNLCYIEGLTPYGGCRLCLVKVEGMKGFPTACSTPAKKDMVIITKDAELQELRREVMKLILSEHPYSCLICENKSHCEELRPSKVKSGRKFGCFSCSNKESCEVREIVDFIELKDVPYELRYKNLPLIRDDPFIEQDYNLCIECGRCVRVCNEVRGSGAIAFLYRGPNTRVSTAYDLLHLDVNCQFCGACVDICPTGVMSSKNMKWVKKTDNCTISICGFCSVGCGFDYYSTDEKLMESIPNKENPVNKGQACVIGRFCTPPFINGLERLKDPLIRKNNDLVPYTWDEAYTTISEELKKYSPEEIAILVSRDLSNESAYILYKLAKKVLKTDNIFTIYDGDTIETLCSLLNKHLNVNLLPRSFQDIPNSKWILLINSNIEDSHPMLQVYLKKAKDNSATIVSLNTGDPEFTSTIKRLIDYELHLTKEEMVAFIILIAKNLIKIKNAQLKSIKNFNEFNSLLEDFIVPKKILNYESVISDFIENGKGTILFSHIAPLPDDYKADLIGVLLDLIILSKNNIQFIPLWRRGNTEGVFQTNSYDNQPFKSVLKKIKSGKVKALYLTERIEDLNLLKNIKFLVIQDIFPSDNFQFANVVLPTCTFIESSGSFVNSELRIQQFNKSASNIGESRTDLKIFSELALQIDNSHIAEFEYINVDEILNEIKDKNLYFKSKKSMKTAFSLQKTSFYIPSLKYPALKTSYEPFNLGSFNYRGEKISNQVADLKGIINYRKLKKSGMLKLEEEKAEKPGFRVLKNEEIIPNMYELIIEAPLIAKKARPGNFVLIMKDEESERLPMTLSNWDESKGTITIYYQERGYSTKELTELSRGETLYTVVGPLGNEITIEKFGTVLLGGGCYGIGGIFPIAKEAKLKGNKVIVILEARNKILFYLEKEFEELADEVIYCTSDGSKGLKGKIEAAIELVIKEGTKIDWCYFIGCKHMMRNASIATKELGPIPTYVSLNTIMIDGTGMCGGCRLSLIQEGKEVTKFACVDGPCFDGHLVNWDELIGRGIQFNEAEVFIYQNHFCKMLEKYRTESP